MNLMKKLQKRLSFLMDQYDFLCVEKSKATICFCNSHTSIVFEYDTHRHEYFDLVITKNDAVMMKVNYGKVFWENNAFADERLSRGLENIFALRQQFVTLSEKQIDELIEIYADYIEDNIDKLK